MKRIERTLAIALSITLMAAVGSPGGPGVSGGARVLVGAAEPTEVPPNFNTFMLVVFLMRGG